MLAHQCPCQKSQPKNVKQKKCPLNGSIVKKRCKRNDKVQVYIDLFVPLLTVNFGAESFLKPFRTQLHNSLAEHYYTDSATYYRLLLKIKRGTHSWRFVARSNHEQNSSHATDLMPKESCPFHSHYRHLPFAPPVKENSVTTF